MRRNGLISLIFILVLTALGIGVTVAYDNEPLLGLDLQGGVAVVLQPTEDVDSDTLDQAMEIIRLRVDEVGVAEPEIARQGDTIIVQLPGVSDRDRALELAEQTAELRFRPVLSLLPPGGITIDPSTSTTGPEDDSTTTEAPGDTTTTEAPAPTDEESGFGMAPGEQAAPVQAEDTTTTTPTTTTPTTTAPANTVPANTVPGSEPVDPTALTGPDDDDPAQTVVLAEYDPEDEDAEVVRYQLGPVPGVEDPDDPDTRALNGDILSAARAELQGVGQWQVAVEIKGNSIDAFNQTASECFNRGPTCPLGQLAIVLDGRVISAPSINEPSFAADQISISGNFDEGSAKDLALALRYGALPVELEPQQTQSVSATLGKDALDAGVTAGVVGLLLVAAYMIVYYRLLGVVAMLSLSVSAALLWTVVALLGEVADLALTLAGVTGIIVSIGVAVDSNVVFYEHLKEDVSRGRSLRSAVDGSFRSAFSTILKADIASLIGALILYRLTVGPVRGFAFFLGLSTLLDIVASYFFMRPVTQMLVRSKRLQDRPRAFGMPAVSGEVSS